MKQSSRIYRGRYTAQIEGDFVVFIIGMRVNKVWAIHKWLPVATAMGPMVRGLLADPALGLLHVENFVYWRGAALVQYWRSFEALERFSREPTQPHLEAWRRFNKAVGVDGSVGIWHERYRVQAGQYECLYGNMPRKGLASAGAHMQATGKMETARRRFGMAGEPTLPSYPAPPD